MAAEGHPKLFPEVLHKSTFVKQSKEMRDRITNLARKRSKRQEDCELGERRRLKRKRPREAEIEKGKARKLKKKTDEETEGIGSLTTLDAVEEELARAPSHTAKQEEASRIDILKKQLQDWQPGK